MYKGSKACRVHSESAELKYIGFRPSSWGEVPQVLRQTFQPQSQTVGFLSLELEIALIALLAKLTCDQSTQSIVYVQDTDICQTSFSLRERVRSSPSV